MYKNRRRPPGEGEMSAVSKVGGEMSEGGNVQGVCPSPYHHALVVRYNANTYVFSYYVR